MLDYTSEPDCDYSKQDLPTIQNGMLELGSSEATEDLLFRLEELLPEIGLDTSERRGHVRAARNLAMKIRQKSTETESLIDRVVGGQSTHYVLRSYLAEQQIRSREVIDTIDVGTSFQAGNPIKTFFDGQGRLRFCDENDVLINPASDYRLQKLMQFADALDVDSPLFDLFEQFEGNLDTLYRKVTDAFSLASQIGT
jgi:hypothetical protein